MEGHNSREKNQAVFHKVTKPKFKRLLDGRLRVVDRRDERPVGKQVERTVEQQVERRVKRPASGIRLYGKLSLLWLSWA